MIHQPNKFQISRYIFFLFEKKIHLNNLRIGKFRQNSGRTTTNPCKSLPYDVTKWMNVRLRTNPSYDEQDHSVDAHLDLKTDFPNVHGAKDMLGMQSFQLISL